MKPHPILRRRPGDTDNQHRHKEVTWLVAQLRARGVELVTFPDPKKPMQAVIVYQAGKAPEGT